MTLSNAQACDVLVIGGGPAGLTAAYLLTKNSSKSVVVLEADPQHVGGISRTEQHQGYLFDIGGHRFFSKSQEVEALWREILPDDFLDRPRTSRILYRGLFYSYPLRAFEALKNLGIFESARCVLSYAWRRMYPVNPPRSFHDWVANQFGERLFSIFFKTYTEKVWGMSCDDISADWAAQRIKGLNLVTAVVSALRKSLGWQRPGKAGDKVVKTLIESFRYPRRGPGMMWDAAAQKTRAQGGAIHMGMKVVALSWDANTALWSVSATTPTGEHQTFVARQVISSAAMRDIVTACTPRPECADLAAKLKYRDFITVAVMLNTAPSFNDNWIYIHDPNVKVGRVQNFSSWSPEMVPAADKACLGLEYFCFEHDALWDSADADLIELAVSELATLHLAQREQVIGAKVIRQMKAYPVYDADYKSIVETIRLEFQQRFPTLHFVGRNGMHKYNNQDHAMMTAMLTVENILAGHARFNIWDVNEDAEYHEETSDDRKQALNSLHSIPTTRT
ncbi:MAG: NAD(P)/FAD-dependent oxidoreductase [Methylococcaceae bacterium]|nr:NAD(P)/FAD-dependent oxidoreductase [Methylococcaceae bacterium]